MMRRTIFTLLLVAIASLPARAQTANTEIYLAPITRIGDSIVVGTPVKVTDHDGYDNQPAFTADSRSILYVARNDGQTDVWRYDIAKRRTTRVTSTPESEYSPTPIPGENRFSVVRVERDSTQRLWSFAMNGSAPRLVLPSLKPVGYHAWLHDGRLAAYVLGTPSTLHLLSRNGARDSVVARNVGRAIEPLSAASKSLFSYTQRDSAGTMRIVIYTGRQQKHRFTHDVVVIARDGRTTRSPVVDSVVALPEPPVTVAVAPSDNEFHAWTPDATLVTATESRLVRWNEVAGARSAWLPVADLRPYGVKNVSRLSFSPNGAWLAFVAEPATQ